MAAELREVLKGVLVRLDRAGVERLVGRPVSETAARLWQELLPATLGWWRWFRENPEAVYQHEGDLRWVLHDLQACARCDGHTCRALINRGHKGPEPPRWRMYYAIAPNPYGPPRFAFFGCDSPSRRRQEALEQIGRAASMAQEAGAA